MCVYRHQQKNCDVTMSTQRTVEMSAPISPACLIDWQKAMSTELVHGPRSRIVWHHMKQSIAAASSLLCARTGASRTRTYVVVVCSYVQCGHIDYYCYFRVAENLKA